MINMDIMGRTFLRGLGWVPSSAFQTVVKTCNKPTAENGFLSVLAQFWLVGSLSTFFTRSELTLMAPLQTQECHFYHNAACVVIAQGKMILKHLGNCLDNLPFRPAPWIHLRAVQGRICCPCPWDLLSLPSPCGGCKGDEFQRRREMPGVTDLYRKPSEIHFPVSEQGHRHTLATTGVRSQLRDKYLGLPSLGAQPRISSTPPHQNCKIQLLSTKAPRRGCCSRGPIESCVSAEIPSCSEGTMALQPAPLSSSQQFPFLCAREALVWQQ